MIVTRGTTSVCALDASSDQSEMGAADVDEWEVWPYHEVDPVDPSIQRSSQPRSSEKFK